jgi:hypothetical protein
VYRMSLLYTVVQHSGYHRPGFVLFNFRLQSLFAEKAASQNLTKSAIDIGSFVVYLFVLYMLIFLPTFIWRIYCLLWLIAMHDIRSTSSFIMLFLLLIAIRACFESV